MNIKAIALCAIIAGLGCSQLRGTEPDEQPNKIEDMSSSVFARLCSEVLKFADDQQRLEGKEKEMLEAFNKVCKDNSDCELRAFVYTFSRLADGEKKSKKIGSLKDVLDNKFDVLSAEEFARACTITGDCKYSDLRLGRYVIEFFSVRK